MTIMSIASATSWVATVFERNGCNENNAFSVARALVAAEADGLKGHGLSRLPTYVQMLQSGKIDGQAHPSAFSRSMPDSASLILRSISPSVSCPRSPPNRVS